MSITILDDRIMAEGTLAAAFSQQRSTVLLAKVLGLSPEEIATIMIRKKDGETIRFSPEKDSGSGEE